MCCKKGISSHQIPLIKKIMPVNEFTTFIVLQLSQKTPVSKSVQFILKKPLSKGILSFPWCISLLQAILIPWALTSTRSNNKYWSNILSFIIFKRYQIIQHLSYSRNFCHMLIFLNSIKYHSEQPEVVFYKSLYFPIKIPILDFRLSYVYGFEARTLLQGCDCSFIF